MNNLRPNILARAFAAGVDQPYPMDLVGLLGETITVQFGKRSAFRVVCADPPWPFKDKLPGEGRGAAKNYDVLSIDDIKAGRFVGGEALRNVADDAYLFLWRMSAGDKIGDLTLAERAYDVARAWGFAPKTEIVWRKQTKNGKRHIGMGWHIRNEHETCILAVRGKPKPLVRNIRSVFDAVAPPNEKGRAIHSKKPDAFYSNIVEKLSHGPYLELFGRRQRDGWTVLGNEVE